LFVVSFRTWQIQNRRQKYPEVFDTAEMYTNSNYEIGGETNEPDVNVIVEVQVPEVQSPGLEVEVEVPQVEVDLNAEANVKIQVDWT